MRRRYWRASALAGLLGLISVGMIDSATAHHTPPRPVAIATVPNLAMHADALLARINVFQQPIKTAGDLSEAADAAPGITTEDLARDLEAAAKSGV